MMKKEQVAQMLDILSTLYPHPTTELVHSNPFELLVATILSAQCTDKRVNMVTPYLFAKCPNPELLSTIPLEQLMHILRSINFFQNKAKHLKAMAVMLLEEFGGQVPSIREDLEKLPGVGRKTANVVLANAFHIPALAVDTHVHRVTNRLGLVHTKEPLKTEVALMKLLPESTWIDAHHYFILHGRSMCSARSPKCTQCPLMPLCAFGKKSL